MALHVWFRGQTMPDLELLEDCDAAYAETRLTGCEYDKLILSEIEHGEYIDNDRYRDRFGLNLKRDEMSSSAKVALVVYHNPDKIVNGIEIGLEAFYTLLKYCKSGHIVLPAEPRLINCDDEKDDSIDVICQGKQYASMWEFADYMLEGVVA